MSFAHPHPANNQTAVPVQPISIGDVWFLERASDKYLAAFDGTEGTAYGRPRMWLHAYEAIDFRDKIMPTSKTLMWVPRP